MVTDEQVVFILKMARQRLAEGKEIDFGAIREAIIRRFGDIYSTKLLRRLYDAEKNNPKFKVKEVPVPYIDVKKEA